MKPTAKQKAYAVEQARRGMVDPSTNRYAALESRVCCMLGDDYSPGDLAQAVRIEGGTVQEARTIISNLGLGTGPLSESKLKYQFGKEYVAPEIMGT